MSIKLLPAAVNPVDPSQASEVSTSLVPLTQRAISTRPTEIRIVPSTDAFVWSSSTRREGAHRVYGTFVEDSPRDDTGHSGWEYVTAEPWSRSVEGTAVAQYLFYAGYLANRSGRLIDVYA
jgi:hypothetical protein